MRLIGNFYQGNISASKGLSLIESERLTPLSTTIPLIIVYVPHSQLKDGNEGVFV